VIIDSGLQSDQIVSFVATDNYKGGELCAERLGTLLGGKGKVLVLRYQEGSASTTEREKGFIDKMKSAYPGITIVSRTSTPARRVRRRSGPPRTSSTGTATSSRDLHTERVVDRRDAARAPGHRQAGKIRIVGFDASKNLLDAMRAKQLDGVPCRAR
jgi:ribose transport system substrate-binding protein